MLGYLDIMFQFRFDIDKLTKHRVRSFVWYLKISIKSLNARSIINKTGTVNDSWLRLKDLLHTLD